MSPIVKKAAAALAIKEIFDRVQEARAPKKSFVARNKGKALWAGVLGGLGFLYKSGKLSPIVNQAKGLVGGSSSSDQTTNNEPAAYPTGPAVETQGPSSDPFATDRPLEPSHS
ncbi:MAG: hypothetical protein M3N53_15210 [Actinomycetota bacterium]|nr:hypothetical protein [Actinomycetota bacterium]